MLDTTRGRLEHHMNLFVLAACCLLVVPAAGAQIAHGAFGYEVHDLNVFYPGAVEGPARRAQ